MTSTSCGPRSRWTVMLPLLCLLCGCLPGGGTSTGRLEQVWGRRGRSEGRFQKPRAMAIDAQNQVYTVDMSGRIQVFSPQGEYLRGWRTPEIATGKPCGLAVGRDGTLLVADTHYYRMLVYTADGLLLDERTIGGQYGIEAGQLALVTDCVQDSQGNYYIAQMGEYADCIQKFSPDGQFLMRWGTHGSRPGQLIQPRSLAVDEQDQIWVADACNHRIQVFDATTDEARLVRMFGTLGRGQGQFRYPYGLALDGSGHVYVCEYANSRIQKFDVEGNYVGSWGQPGYRDGELNQPWDIALDEDGYLLVLDTYNHRVQRIRF